MATVGKEREQNGHSKDATLVTLSSCCRVFHERTKELFLPALILTGSLKHAEECFVRAIELVGQYAAVEDQYVYFITRRCVIKAALEVIADDIRACAGIERQLRDDGTGLVICPSGRTAKDLRVSVVPSLLRLNPLRRAALVLRRFERYHRKDAALLLDVPVSLAEVASSRGLREYLCHLLADEHSSHTTVA